MGERDRDRGSVWVGEAEKAIPVHAMPSLCSSLSCLLLAKLQDPFKKDPPLKQTDRIGIRLHPCACKFFAVCTEPSGTILFTPPLTRVAMETKQWRRRSEEPRGGREGGGDVKPATVTPAEGTRASPGNLPGSEGGGEQMT